MKVNKKDHSKRLHCDNKNMVIKTLFPKRKKYTTKKLRIKMPKDCLIARLEMKK